MTVHRVIFWSFVLTLFTLICLIWKKFGGNWLQYNVCPSWTWMLVNSKCIINLFLFKRKARIIHVESKREHKYVPVSLNMSEIIGSSKYAQSPKWKLYMRELVFLEGAAGPYIPKIQAMPKLGWPPMRSQPDLSLPSPSLWDRSCEHCPTCLREILSSELAAHIVRFHWFYSWLKIYV